MKMICDVPDEVIKSVRMGTWCGSSVLEKMVAKGTPLPKGHGRLGDLDAIWDKLKELEEHYQAEFLKDSNAIHESSMYGRLCGFTNSKFIVQDAPTIIEADKAESED